MFEQVTNKQLLRSMLAEVAKAKNEIKCAKADLEKAENRVAFLIMLTNKLIEREKD